jgi:hypothetical protein
VRRISLVALLAVLAVGAAAADCQDPTALHFAAGGTGGKGGTSSSTAASTSAASSGGGGACAPTPCPSGVQCGAAPDGCGGVLDCGTCGPGDGCDSDGRCAPLAGAGGASSAGASSSSVSSGSGSGGATTSSSTAASSTTSAASSSTTASSTTASSSSGAPACAHLPCSAGAPLDPACDPCVALTQTNEPSCAAPNPWTIACVEDLSNQYCQGACYVEHGPGDCGRNPCATGAPLPGSFTDACSIPVYEACAAYPGCCADGGTWTQTCVAYAEADGLQCP